MVKIREMIPRSWVHVALVQMPAVIQMTNELVPNMRPTIVTQSLLLNLATVPKIHNLFRSIAKAGQTEYKIAFKYCLLVCAKMIHRVMLIGQSRMVDRINRRQPPRLRLVYGSPHTMTYLLYALMEHFRL